MRDDYIPTENGAEHTRAVKTVKPLGGQKNIHPEYIRQSGYLRQVEEEESYFLDDGKSNTQR